MAKVEQTQKQQPMKDEDSKEHSFKGTFVSVMLLGGFLIVSWIGVWALFLSR
ncbi:cytochrome c oxidase subunit 2A [Virgibacillus sp. W0181]|uniref:cytochrome c oxidase subunit 2A n=1 Tax=Virgibacillus sp. W0181 TaxID=3391581 RepID=UPI003F468809